MPTKEGSSFVANIHPPDAASAVDISGYDLYSLGGANGPKFREIIGQTHLLHPLHLRIDLAILIPR